MISARSKFKIVKKGFKDTIVLVPGWATDYRIFDTLDLRYNYVLPVEFNPVDFKDALSDFLRTLAIERISLFGWSQGGFMASDFASHYSEKIDSLILVGICKRYDQNAIEEITHKLKQNKRAFLYKFYLDCFSPYDNQGRSWFKTHMLRKYMDTISLEYLMAGLDYLSCAQIKTEFLSGIKMIKIIHGGQDTIAPLEEAREIKSCLAQAQFIVLNRLGHLPFLNMDFMERFNG